MRGAMHGAACGAVCWVVVQLCMRRMARGITRGRVEIEKMFCSAVRAELGPESWGIHCARAGHAVGDFSRKKSERSVFRPSPSPGQSGVAPYTYAVSMFGHPPD